jgi:hypothetical protein
MGHFQAASPVAFRLSTQAVQGSVGAVVNPHFFFHRSQLGSY